MIKTEKKPLILIVDDDVSTINIVQDILNHEGYNVLAAKNGYEALEYFENNPVDLVLLDYKLPGMDGIVVLRRMKSINPLIPVLIISGHGDIPLALKATQVGAVDFIEKTKTDANDLLKRIKKQLELGARLQKSNIEVNQTFQKYGMIGASSKMQNVYSLIDQVAATNAKVLISGRTGVGKELVANAIHLLSRRKDLPFIKLKCASIPVELIESELFGFHKYSFTDAKVDRKGKFQQADNGTLFLDEIGDMNMMAQSKVLRAIDEGEVQRIGSEKTEKIDVRIIAASNKNLAEQANLGKFREDLYYRLNVVTIEVPALDERKDDIPFLAEYFLKTFCDQYNKKQKHITNRAMECLINQDWKGNVRELRNLMEKLVIFVTEEIIDLKHLKEIFGRQRMSEKLELNFPLKQARDQFEKEYIETKLIANGWKIGETADQLGIERTNLYRKMRQLGLNR